MDQVPESWVISMVRDLLESMDNLHPIGSMVLVYLLTKLGDFVRANVGIHILYMEHMGIIMMDHIIVQGNRSFLDTSKYMQTKPSM